MRIRSSFLHLAREIALASLTALLVVALAAGTSLAAKGGGGTSHNGGGGQSTSPSGTLVSDCNPCAFGSYAHLTGSGLDGSQPRGMVAVTSSTGGTAWAGINVNPDGTTSFSWYMNPAGMYTFQVFQQVHKKLGLKAELDGVIVQ